MRCPRARTRRRTSAIATADRCTRKLHWLRNASAYPPVRGHLSTRHNGKFAADGGSTRWTARWHYWPRDTRPGPIGVAARPATRCDHVVGGAVGGQREERNGGYLSPCAPSTVSARSAGRRPSPAGRSADLGRPVSRAPPVDNACRARADQAQGLRRGLVDRGIHDHHCGGRGDRSAPTTGSLASSPTGARGAGHRQVFATVTQHRVRVLPVIDGTDLVDMVALVDAARALDAPGADRLVDALSLG
uniref:CBS domain containing protein n=1 Tax=Streptomyces pratensis (strain ATCC 33331 / IAF-45CD) TaxID=591167 RepID=A0A8D3WSS3_STRFA